MKQKAFFITFKRLSVKQITLFLEDESQTLTTNKSLTLNGEDTILILVLLQQYLQCLIIFCLISVEIKAR